ncbi:MAG TPA: CdaR family protein [Feifaniaceae bacterium]|nr:CdaR family protein [Feifaniaceae bacterium]
MERENEPGKIGAFFKNFFTKNIGSKILSLVFATVLWGVVLTVQNPNRVKVIENVPVIFEGTSDLNNRNLVVRGNPLEELGGVAVRVSTPITNYMNLNADQINAYISLNRITTTGTVALPVEADVSGRPPNTNVESSSPNKIMVEIDTLMTKNVPVWPSYEGVLPDGYWHDDAELSSSSVTVRGPKQDVDRVTRAVCKIRLTDRRQSYNDAVAVALLDETGSEMDSSLFLDILPSSVTVRMPVYPKKTVPVDIMGSLLGADNLPANYELFAAAATPATIDIAGDQAALDSITSLKIPGLDVAGRRESIHQEAAIIVPEDVRILGSTTEVEVFVDIREKTSKKDFAAIPIEARNLGRGLKATLSKETADISVEGRVSLVDLLDRDDVEAYVDLKDLKEGTYEMYVSVYLKNDETTLELTSVSSVALIQVIVARK